LDLAQNRAEVLSRSVVPGTGLQFFRRVRVAEEMFVDWGAALLFEIEQQGDGRLSLHVGAVAQRSHLLESQLADIKPRVLRMRCGDQPITAALRRRLGEESGHPPKHLDETSGGFAAIGERT